jgi:HEAT repeat protein
MKVKAGFLALLLCGLTSVGFAGVEQTVNELLPALAAPRVQDRYAAQMELQGLAVKAARPGAEAERSEFAKVLAAKATDATVPQPARVWIVRQIEYIGGAESVTSLSLLLNGQDAELKECARRALEKNPAPEAGEVLRTALQQGGDTSWKIGLIRSLGEREDAKAVDLIKTHLSQQETAAAAASALGKIASADSIRALWDAYDAGNTVAADELITAGNRLSKAGKKKDAASVFSRLYSAGTASKGAATAQQKEPPAPAQVCGAALIGWATADPKAVRPLVEESLRGGERRLQFAAVTAATAAYGKDGASAALAPLLPELPLTAKVFVLYALDRSAEKQVMAAAGDQDEAVRMAALERLGQIGSAASVPVLVRAAAEDSSGTRKVAEAALTRVSGPGTGTAIAKLAETGDAGPRTAAIRALAARGDKNALPALVKYAAESDRSVSGAACAALGKLGADNELDGLARLALAGNTPGAEEGLLAVARRSNRKVAVEKLVGFTQTADPQKVGLLYETLTAVGGSEALAAVSSAVSSSNEQVKNAAIRALANWPDLAATGPLLAIAADPNTTRVHQVLAIQGVVRLVKASDNAPAAARLEAATGAINSAKRDEDKRLVFSAFASVPDPKSADAIKPYLSDAKFGTDAGLAAVTLADTLRKTDKVAAQNLAEAVKAANLSEDLTRKADAVLKKN